MLTKLKSDNFSFVRNLFPIEFPNQAFALGVMENKLPGNIWLNETKTACLLATNSPFCFVTGAIDSNFLSKCLNLLKAKSSLILVSCTDPDLFQNNGLVTKTRIQFSAWPDQIKILDINIPNYYQLYSIDNNLFERCQWRHKILEIFKNVDNFIKYGFGACYLFQDKIHSEIYGVIGGGYFEIGAFTDNNQRNKGLALSLFLEKVPIYCRQNSLKIVTSCFTENTASAKSSRRVGLVEDRHYEVLFIDNLL